MLPATKDGATPTPRAPSGGGLAGSGELHGEIPRRSFVDDRWAEPIFGKAKSSKSSQFFSLKSRGKIDRGSTFGSFRLRI